MGNQQSRSNQSPVTSSPGWATLTGSSFCGVSTLSRPYLLGMEQEVFCMQSRPGIPQTHQPRATTPHLPPNNAYPAFPMPGQTPKAASTFHTEICQTRDRNRE